jgi:hypothetical protein
MEPIHQNDTASSNEITFRDVVLKVKETYFEVKKGWKTILIFISVTLLAALYNYWTTPKKYMATLTFMVNENKGGGGLAGAASILNSLGMQAPMEDNLDKILALSKSFRIIQDALLTKTQVDGEDDFLGNHIIRIYNLYEKDWKKTAVLKGFRFTRSSLDSFSVAERKAIKSIYGIVVGTESKEGLMVNSQSRLTSIMTMKVTTVSDELSVSLARIIFQRLSDFYIEKTVEREAETYKLVKRKVDSLKSVLVGADYRQAKFEDSNRGLLMETVKVPTKQLSRDVNRLTIMYGEAVKNLELSDFALKNKRPYVQVIDMPFSPNEPSIRSLSKAVVIGIGLGILAGTLFLIFRRLIKDSLKQ